MNPDDKIRAILQLEADTVEPSAAGWDAIQAGVAARRTRVWWTRGVALAGAGALALGGVVYVAADRSPRGIEQTPASPGPGQSGSPAPSGSASPTATPPVVAAPDEPIDAVWPLTTTGEVAAWQRDRSTYPSLATATGSVTAFATTYLGIDAPTVQALGGQFGENAFEVRREGQLVSTVTVKGFGEGGTAPFVATGAEARDLRITSPTPGAAVNGPLAAEGLYEAVDPALQVVLRADSGAVAPVELASVRATTGPDGWQARLTYVTKAKTGSLLVTNASLRDGGIGSAAVVPVNFGAAPVTAGPQAFVAVRGGRVAVLSAVTGEVVRWLTPSVAGMGAFDPRLSDDGKTVVYAQSPLGSPCATEIRSVPVAGGESTVVARVDGLARGPALRQGVVAYVKTDCDGMSPEEVVVSGGGVAVAEEVRGEVVGGVAFVDRFVVYIAYGEPAVLHSVDLYGELADAPVAAPEGCTWTAVTAGPKDGNGRERMFAAASCGPREAESRLYRLDADGRDLTLVGPLDVPGRIASIDYAGEHLILQTGFSLDATAWSYAEGKTRRIPGVAERPSWS